MKKNGFAAIFGVLIMIALIVWSIATGIAGLRVSRVVPVSENVQKGDLCEVEVDYAFEIYEVKHTLNLIPTGKEHYYFVEAEEYEIPLVVKATTSWYNKNFDEDGIAYNTVTVKGRVEKLDHDFVSDFAELNNDLAEYDIHFSTSLYLSAGYKKMYTLRLVSGILLLVAAAVVAVLFLKGQLATKAGGAAVVLVIIAMLFSCFVFLFGETI